MSVTLAFHQATAGDQSLVALAEATEPLDIGRSKAFYAAYMAAARGEVGRDAYARDRFARLALVAASGKIVQPPRIDNAAIESDPTRGVKLETLAKRLAGISECRAPTTENL